MENKRQLDLKEYLALLLPVGRAMWRILWAKIEADLHGWQVKGYFSLLRFKPHLQMSFIELLFHVFFHF